MSEFCWVSKIRVPLRMAWTVPGSIWKKSPFLMGRILIKSIQRFSSIIRQSSSFVPALWPTTMVASGSQSRMYQHSVFPREPFSCSLA